MKRGILLTSSDNYSSYSTKVIIFDTPEEAQIKFEQLQSELDKMELDDWYTYPTLIKVEVYKQTLKE